MHKKIIITGGAGFIGVNLVNAALAQGHKVLVIDKLTYAGFKGSLDLKNKNLFFKKFDICNKALMKKAIIDFKPNYFYNLAAESHVDRSIDSPEAFVKTNIIGTFNIIEFCFYYFNYVMRVMEEPESLRLDFPNYFTSKHT